MILYSTRVFDWPKCPPLEKEMKRASALVLLLACLLLPGCLYSNITVPLDSDLDNTQMGNKVGSAEFQSVLGLFAWGDAGTQAAARDGGISTLRQADLKIFSILGFVYYRQTTVVYGD